MRTLEIAPRGTSLLGVLLAVLLLVPADSATAQGFKVGLDKDRPGEVDTDKRRKRYTQLSSGGIRKFNKGLSAICPCLLIHAVPKGKNKGTVYVRDPRNADDMTKDEKKAFPKKLRDRKAKDLCDCYKKHRIGCNLIWELSQSKKDINLWRSKTQKGNSGESRHFRGNVSWNFKNSLSPPLHIRDDVSTPPHTPTETMLGHELAHAYMWMKAGYPDRKRTEAEEIDASHAENQIRAELTKAELAKNKTKKVRLIRLSPRAEYDYDGKPLEITGTKEIITAKDLLKCDKKKEVALMSPEGEPIEDPSVTETSYAIATQVPEVCVGTTYTITEGTVLEEEVPLVTEDDEDPEGVPQEEIPVASVPNESGGPKDVPNLPVVSTPEDAEDPRDTPEEDVPVVSVPKDEGDPSDVPQQDVPVSSTPEQTDEPEDEGIDLGLVKAQQRIVELALIDKADGEPVSSVAVKTLADEPPLPGGETTDVAFDTDSFFEDDVDGGYSSEDGSVALASPSVPASAPDGPRTGLAGEPDANPAEAEDASGNGQALKVTVDREPREQLVVSVTGDAPESAALFDTEAHPDIAPFITNAFSIGDQSFLVLSGPSSAIPALKTRVENEATVSWFEPDPCRDKEEIDDPYFNEAGLWGQDFDDQWAVKRVGFTGALLTRAREETDARKTIVAVIDTGVDWYHPDFNEGSLWRNADEVPDNGVDDDGNGYVDDVIGWNFVRHSNRPWDHDGHGTFVAGVIAAATNNAVGIAGVNPHARIMPLKALDAFGRGHASAIAEAIAYAADNGAKVINLSLGGRGLTRIEKIAIDHANAAGALVVVAAGNDAADVAEQSPAGLDGVITVSATDRRDRRAGFSNWGEEVDISAPGVDVLSLRARRTDLLSYIRGVKYDVGAGVVGAGRAYYRASGTSFATPIVSGAASLLMSLRPDLDAAAVRRMLLNSARDIEVPGIDNYAGYGLIDVDAALNADPAFNIESRITGAKPARVDGNPVLRLVGTANADDFADATLSLGKGKEPSKWLTIKKRITEPVQDDVLMDIPTAALKGAKEWTIRLITKHKDGTERESRIAVTLG